MTNNQIEPFEQSTDNVLAKSIQHILSGITGIAAAEPKEIKLSIGHILQSTIAGKFLSSLQKEWQQFKKKGRIKDDYEQTEQHRTCLKELFEYLERGISDESILKVLNRIFLIAATEKHSTRNDFLPQEYMKIATGLTPGEILLLESAYGITKAEMDSQNPSNLSGEEWSCKVAESSSLKHKDLVYRDAGGLSKKHMTHGIFASENLRSRNLPRPYLGLTELGYGFCEYINHYKGEDTNENLANQA